MSRRGKATPLQKYLDACEQYSIAPDAAVTAVLKTEFSALALSPGLSGPGCMLTLLEILPMCSYVKSLRLVPNSQCQLARNGGSAGDVDAIVMSRILRECPHITEFILEGCHFSPDAFKELAQAIGESTSLVRVTIRSCMLGNEGCAILTEAIRKNTSIVELDASYNWLGGRSMTALHDALQEGAEDVGVVLFEARGNAWFQEIWNSVTHGIGSLASLVGGIVLVYHASVDSQRLWASLVYCFTLVALYTASSLYHAFFMLRTTSSVFMVLDHSAIYLLIAGSYTPFCLVTLAQTEGNVGIIVAAVEWILALCGITFAAVCAYLKVRPLVQMLVELTLYLTMGWAALAVWDGLSANLSERGMELLVMGGACYTGGIIFFLAEKFHPASHTIWHCFVMVGSVIHYFTVLYYVVGFRPDTQIPDIVINPQSLMKWIQEQQLTLDASSIIHGYLDQ